MIMKSSDIATTHVANCPFCGDKSFPIDIKGVFSIGRTDKVIWTGTETGADGEFIHGTAKA